MPGPVIHVFRLDYHIKLKSEGGVAYRSGSPPRGRRGGIRFLQPRTSLLPGKELDFKKKKPNPGRHNYCLHSRGVRPDPPIIINYSLLSFRVLFIPFQFQRALFFSYTRTWLGGHRTDAISPWTGRLGRGSGVRSGGGAPRGDVLFI